MRIVMNMFWEGATKEQYESLRKTVKWEENIPQGGVIHIASFDDKGLHITDVWESAEDFNHFVNDRLMPEVKKQGIPGEPKVEIRPLHALFTPKV